MLAASGRLFRAATDSLRGFRYRHRFPPGVYIDVGARAGYSFWRKELGLGRGNVVVHAFEPNPASMADLLPYAERFPKLHLHPQAVSLENGKRRFHITRNPDCATLLEPIAEVAEQNALIPPHSLDVIETIEVETITLESFLQRERIESVELLKVDTEGHDLDVVKSAGDDIRRIKRIQMEVQSGPEYYVGGTRQEQAVAYLAGRGFCLVKKWDHPHGWAHDLTFEREPLR
ncbi:MAG TPA: FkbM family methyltransferase [Myxococcota bacterium]|nr:FkbM family methyltransferase [Myxococcota bacterium]